MDDQKQIKEENKIKDIVKKNENNIGIKDKKD